VDAAQIALERGLSLRSLEETERRAGALLEAVPDNVYRVSVDGVFREAHASKQSAIFPPGIVYPGIPEDTLVGQRVQDVMPEIAEHLLRGVELALAEGSGTVEFPIETPIGTRELELRTAPSGPDEAVGIVRDFTERRRQERDLARLLDEQAALRRLATLAASSADSDPDAVFAAVAEEVGRLFDAQTAATSRFRGNDATVVGSWAVEESTRIPRGTEIPLDSDTPLVQVFRTGEPARIEGYEGLSGDLARRNREAGWTGAVTAPVYVSGRLWGAITAARSTGEPFAEGVEQRLVQFGEIVGIAIANAEARESLAAIAAEQAALTRVALGVATSSRPEEIFGTVTTEVGRLLGADAANLVRFVDERHGTIVGRWSVSPEVEIADIGESIELDGGPLTLARDEGRPNRWTQEDTNITPRLAERLRAYGVTALVAAPIAVGGEPWGAVAVSVTDGKPIPADAEARTEAFARLVAVAVANAEARDALTALADEQTALKRVALAIATESDPGVLFDVVSEEAGRLLGAASAATVRYLEGEDASVIVGGWHRDGEFDRKGVRVPFQRGAIARVHDSGRPERVDIASMAPDVRTRMLEEGVAAQVAAPIVVSGQLWGATSVSCGLDERFGAEAEARLGQFTDLVAVALANAEARESLAALAREQAALGRVAVAVATEQSPERVFDVVTEEIARLVGAHAGSTVRYLEDEEAVVVVGNWEMTDDYERQKGETYALGGGAITKVKETGLPARTLYQVQRGAEREMVAAPIVVSGKLWGAATVSVHSPERFPENVEERLGAFTRLVAVALANAEAREELTASRARIVQAGDAERRRLERNLHDGAQQRLVALALTLRLAESRLPDDPAAAKALLAQASDDLALGLEELRELARGIHPAILTDRGLAPALEALADRAAVPVRVEGLPDERLPEPIEAAAFYVVAESLTNVAKYASATEARVGVSRDNGLVVVEVSDDGVGGADASKGSGLRGLADRVEALGGRLAVASEAGRGTTVRAELPLV
jgi:signal transduction histidine kinase